MCIQKIHICVLQKKCSNGASRHGTSGLVTTMESIYIIIIRIHVL